MRTSGLRSWGWIAAGVFAGALLHGVAGWWSPPVSAQIGAGCGTTTGNTTHTCSTTAVEICNLPGGGTSVVDACTTPAGCACPAFTSKVQTGVTTAITTTQAIGPGSIMTGTCKSQPFTLAPGTTNINVNTETTTTFACVLNASAAIAKTFGAAAIAVGGTTSLTFTLTNPNAGFPLTGVAFTDTLPGGLVVATPNGLTGSCGGGTITATPGSSSVSLAAGTIAASGSCSFAVNVTATSAGPKNNTTSAVTSNEAGPSGTASAVLAVDPGAIPTLGPWAFLLLVLLLAAVAVRALRTKTF